MGDLKFTLTEIKAEGALASATVTDAENNKFEITVGVCDSHIKRNTRGKWDSIVNHAAGILNILHYIELAYGTKMPTSLVVDEQELRRWQRNDA